jgi:hypothetical protein
LLGEFRFLHGELSSLRVEFSQILTFWVDRLFPGRSNPESIRWQEAVF